MSAYAAEPRLRFKKKVFPSMSPLCLSRNICSGAPVNRTSNWKGHFLRSLSSTGSSPLVQRNSGFSCDAVPSGGSIHVTYGSIVCR
jgi:hypothetical protein